MRTLLISILLIAVTVFSCSDSDSADSSSLSGQGGSMARFALTDTHLYTVNGRTLTIYEILQDGSLEKMNTRDYDLDIETIQVKDNWLYLGTTTGMMILDITNRVSPAFTSMYSHLIACDPVVVQDTLAFVTIRTSLCRPLNTFNTLEIINIKDPASPAVVSVFNLESPYGLGVDGDLLFVCEGNNGLRVLDVSDPRNISFVKKYNMHAYDVIPNDGILILTGDEGIAQYNYADPNNITKLSTIPVRP